MWIIILTPSTVKWSCNGQHHVFFWIVAVALVRRYLCAGGRDNASDVETHFHLRYIEVQPCDRVFALRFKELAPSHSTCGWLLCWFPVCLFSCILMELAHSVGRFFSFGSSSAVLSDSLHPVQVDWWFDIEQLRLFWVGFFFLNQWLTIELHSFIHDKREQRCCWAVSADSVSVRRSHAVVNKKKRWNVKERWSLNNTTKWWQYL